MEVMTKILARFSALILISALSSIKLDAMDPATQALGMAVMSHGAFTAKAVATATESTQVVFNTQANHSSGLSDLLTNPTINNVVDTFQIRPLQTTLNVYQTLQANPQQHQIAASIWQKYAALIQEFQAWKNQSTNNKGLLEATILSDQAKAIDACEHLVNAIEVGDSLQAFKACYELAKTQLSLPGFENCFFSEVKKLILKAHFDKDGRFTALSPQKSKILQTAVDLFKAKIEAWEQRGESNYISYFLGGDTVPISRVPTAFESKILSNGYNEDCNTIMKLCEQKKFQEALDIAKKYEPSTTNSGYRTNLVEYIQGKITTEYARNPYSLSPEVAQQRDPFIKALQDCFQENSKEIKIDYQKISPPSVGAISGINSNKIIELQNNFKADYFKASESGDFEQKLRYGKRIQATKVMSEQFKITTEYSDSIVKFLQEHNLDPNVLSTFSGNSLQLCIHEELCFILEKTKDLADKSLIDELQTDMLCTCTTVAHQANIAGEVTTAYAFADFCHATLDCVTAMGQGAKEGIVETFQDIKAHPVSYTATTVGALVATPYIAASRLGAATFKIVSLIGNANLTARAGEVAKNAASQPITQTLRDATKFGVSTLLHIGIGNLADKGLQTVSNFEFIKGILNFFKSKIRVPALVTPGNVPSPSRNINLMSMVETTNQSATKNALKTGSESLNQLVRNNPGLQTIAERYGTDTLQKTVDVCKINPLARLGQVAVQDLEILAEKISVLQSNPEWTKLAIDQVTGEMTVSSINKAYVQVQQTAISENTLTQAVPLPQTATAAAAVQPKMAGAMQQTVSGTRVVQSASAGIAMHLTEAEFAQLLKANPQIFSMTKKLGAGSAKKALELCNINPSAILDQSTLAQVESMAQKIKVIYSNRKEWEALACDPGTGTVTSQYVEKAFNSIKSLSNKGQMVNGKQQLSIPQALKKNISGSNWGKPTQIKDSYEGAFSKKGFDHVFQPGHMRDGILDLGKPTLSRDLNKEYIFNKLTKVVFKVDRAGFLVEGDNEIRFIMNGREATVRIFMQNNTLMTWDAFAGYSNRVKGHLTIW